MAGASRYIVVIGAGAAGIAAARTLHEARADYLVLEARDRVGGRALTFESVQGGIDLGCGWLHSADRNPWVAIAHAQGRTIDKTLPPWARANSQVGRPAAALAGFGEALGASRERLEVWPTDQPDRPADAFLQPGGPWNPLIDAVSTYYSGAELSRISTHDLQRYEDTGVNWRVVEGYGRTIAAHGSGLNVRLNCEVLRIDHSGRRIRLETSQGAVEADIAIIALPSAILARTEGLFAPGLRDKRGAAEGLPLGLADKLFLSLSDAEEFPAESRAFGATDRAETGAYQFRPFGRPLIEAYFGGRWAADLEKGGPPSFFEFARDELCSLFGADFARRIAPLQMHLWGADRFSGGSYSFARPGMADCRDRLAEPVDGRMFFAGEACSRSDYSTAHGAYRTGVAAAKQALAVKAGGRR